MRVLIAHGNAEAQSALAAAIRAQDGETLEFLTSRDPAETLEALLQDEPPEVAFIDWDLPGIDGPEMCRLVRDFHHGHDTWMVVLAGSAHPDTGEAWRSGADGCVQTPATASDLRACIEKGMREILTPRAIADLASVRIEDEAGPAGDAAGPATLDAVRMPEGSGDFYGFSAPGLRATADPEDDRSGHWARRDSGGADDWPPSGRGRSDEPSGAALLEAVLQQP